MSPQIADIAKPYKDSDAKERSVWGRGLAWALGSGISTFALMKGAETLLGLKPDQESIALGSAAISAVGTGMIGAFETRSHNRTAHLIRNYEALEQSGQLTLDRVQVSPHFQRRASMLGAGVEGALAGGAIGAGYDILTKGLFQQQWLSYKELHQGSTIPSSVFGAALGMAQAAEHNQVRAIQQHFAAKAELGAMGFAARELERGEIPAARGL